MQRLLNRFAWRNLSIQAKTGLMFASLVALLAVLAVFSIVALGAVEQQVSGLVGTALELRTLVRDTQASVEDLQRIETRLLDDSLTADFDPATSRLDDQFSEASQAILEEQIPLLEQIARQQVTDEREREFLLAEINNLRSNIEAISDAFDANFDILTDLYAVEDGTFRAVNQYSDAIEQEILDRGNSTLVVQFTLMENLEDSLPETGRNGYEELLAASGALLESYNQLVPLDLRDATFAATVDSYQQTAGQAVELLVRLELNRSANVVTFNRARGATSRIGNLAEAQATRQSEAINQVQNRIRTLLLAGLGAVLVVGGVMTYLFASDLRRRVGTLLNTAQEFEAGNLRVRAELRGEDEFSQLALSFNAMAVQLEGLVGGLEQRVAERTRDLTITAEIGQSVVALRDPRILMNEVVELIRRRFGFYHAQVFLLDEEGKRANLVASTGAAGRELLARRHFLEVGSLSVIGQVTATGEPVIALDTSTSEVHRRNELLPDTRSEMALPMRVGDRVIGSLDVQSVAPNAFDADAVAVFQIMADQLAIALENARLYNELEYSKGLLQVMERRATADAWQSYQRERPTNKPLSYMLEDEKVEAVDRTADPALEQAIQRGRMVTQTNGGVNLAVPIRVRGEVIGAFGFSGEDLDNLSDEDITLIQAVIDRVGLALENLRLVEQTSRRAEYEQLVNAITAKIVGSTDVNHILQTTVRELGRVLRAPQTSVQLRSTSEDASS